MAGFRAFSVGLPRHAVGRPPMPIVDRALVGRPVAPEPVPEPVPAQEPVVEAAKPADDWRPQPYPAGAMVGGSRVQPGDILYKLDDLVRLVSRETGLSVEDITGPVRRTPLVRARFVVSWLARRFTRAGLPGIGRALGGRDHTTILNGVRQVDHWIASAGIAVTSDPVEMAAALIALDRRIYPGPAR